MKKIFLFATAMTALLATSCSNEDNSNVDKSGYSAIELGGVNSKPLTRAGFTGAQTTLKVHYVSMRKDFNAETFPYKDGEGKAALYMTSTATAAVDGTNNETSVSSVSQTSDQMRYWDDLHGKNSILSLYAIAVPNKLTISKNATAFNGWDTNVKEGQTSVIAHTVSWQVSTTQTSETIADEDLAYSNNIVGDNTLGFNASTTKFEKAENTKALNFQHALTRLTINVSKGNGFGDFATEFNVTKVTLASPTTSGSLDVANGTMTSSATNDVEVVGTQADYKDNESKQIGYTYLAQIFPGKTIFGDDNTFLSIVVDGNNYYIKGSEIYSALLSANTGKDEELKTLKQGVNYQLFINIKKTGIEIMSAKLVPWETVNATAMEPSNAIALSAEMEQSAGTQTTFASDLYRSTSLATGYTASGNKTTLAETNVMGDVWYWPNNTTKYYFRTISPQETTVNTTDGRDYITMTGGAIATANDFIWGATLKETHSDAPHTFNYSNGYDTYLHDAIGVTSTKIHITQFHMMSNIEVDLATTSTDDQVDLSNASVEILGFYNTATLALNNAYIATTGDKVTSQAMTTTDHVKHTWRVVPQSTSGVTFKITAEGNVYVVNLPADTSIDTWLPGKSYVYKFTLKKTGILITSAKLVDWIEIKADNKDVTLEQ